MSDYYHWVIESLAEWFMQLFFDPAYHFEAPVETCASVTAQEVIEKVAVIGSSIEKAIGDGLSVWTTSLTTVLEEMQYLLYTQTSRHLNLQVALNQWIN